MFYIWYAVIIITSTIGIVEIIRLIEQKMMSVKQKPYIFSLLPLQGHVEQVEFLVRSIITENRWENFNSQVTMIIIDMGLDEETQNICKNISGEYPFIVFCKQNEIDTVLKEKIHLQTI
jgi:hypothetical protein